MSEERKLREKELTERRALVAKKQEINAELERREKARRDAMAAPSSADRSTRDGARQATTTGAAHAITEADEEGLMSADSAAEIFEHSSKSRRDLLAAFSSGIKTRSGSSSTTMTDLGSSSIDSTTPYSLLRGFGSREG